MSHRIAMVGGFDVSNFGDLLFPLVAQAALEPRLPGLQVDAYGYRSMTTPQWPYPVRPVHDLLGSIAEYDALLIGGGLIVRSDNTIAAGYVPTDPRVNHPLGLWLIPTLTAKLVGTPVIWNTPGVGPDMSPQLAPVVSLAAAATDHLTVRDPTSARRLAALAPLQQIDIVPDTVFGIGPQIPEQPSDAYLDWTRDTDISGPYVLLQASHHSEVASSHVAPVLEAARRHGAMVVEIAVGPVNGDRIGRTGLRTDRVVSAYPSPTLFAEMVARADAVIGDSFHLTVVASATGVPVYRPHPVTGRPTEALLGLQRVYTWDVSAPPLDPATLHDFGAAPPGTDIAERVAQIEAHWNRVAAIVRGEDADEGSRSAFLRAQLPTALGEVLAGTLE